VPPTPGQSIVKRPDNEHLFSLGSVFDDKGYDSMFVYGGYGYFDNMNYFFANNGYRIADRSDIPRDKVHFGNVWGVSDEDLFTLALDEADKSYASGKPFFSHVMTTSNHPPFTFPPNRIDLASGKSGRDGAVKYTDWAIGDFIKRAQTKPWFDDTIFVITADHCSASWGRSSLPVYRYHIPLLVYSPKHIEPATIGRLMAQIDIPPTILGLLDFTYTSSFYGYDIMKLEPGRERILLGNYQKVGYLRGDILTVLAPKQSVQQSTPKFDHSGDATPLTQTNAELIDEAVAYYQTASYRFGHELMKAHREGTAPQTSAATRSF
jgi:phosphoglycerol transferase MdoB-like AlkP superfamily enzyme